MTERLYTQRQIAELLGISRVAVNKRARKDGWKVAKQEVIRGGRAAVHAYTDLPHDTRKRIDDAETAARQRSERIQAATKRMSTWMRIDAHPSRTVRWLARLLRPVIIEALRAENADD